MKMGRDMCVVLSCSLAIGQYSCTPYCTDSSGPTYSSLAIGLSLPLRVRPSFFPHSFFSEKKQEICGE